jgi:hypothetical protein
MSSFHARFSRQILSRKRVFPFLRTTDWYRGPMVDTLLATLLHFTVNKIFKNKFKYTVFIDLNWGHGFEDRTVARQQSSQSVNYNLTGKLLELQLTFIQRENIKLRD